MGPLNGWAGWPFQQYLRGFADRTGILAFGSLPLTVILAARNSPITWVTGATFDTLQARILASLVCRALTTARRSTTAGSLALPL